LQYFKATTLASVWTDEAYCQLDKPSASEVNTLPNSGLPAVSLIAPVSKVTVEAVPG
jgi:hypothetical protein